MLWQCMDLTLCCCSINSYCCKLLHVIKFPNFHTSIFHISPAVHIFISPPFCCSDNAKGLCFGRVVIRHRFYKLPSVSQIFHTFVWLFVPSFCLRRLFVDSVRQSCQTIVKLRHRHMYYPTSLQWDVNAYKQPPGVWRLCLVTIAKLSDYGVSFHHKGVSLLLQKMRFIHPRSVVCHFKKLS